MVNPGFTDTAIASRPNKLTIAKRLQRSQKGFTEVATTTSQGLPSVVKPNQSRAILWACTKDWPWLICSLRGFIGLWEVSKQSYFHHRLVADCAAIYTIVGTLCNPVATYRRLISDEADIKQCFIGDWSPFSCRVVSERVQIICRRQ